MNKNNINIKNKLCKSLFYSAILPLAGCSKLSNGSNAEKLGALNRKYASFSVLANNGPNHNVASRGKYNWGGLLKQMGKPSEENYFKMKVQSIGNQRRAIVGNIIRDLRIQQEAGLHKLLNREGRYHQQYELLARPTEAELRPTRAELDKLLTGPTGEELYESLITLAESKVEERIENKPISKIRRLWMWLRNKGKRAN